MIVSLFTKITLAFWCTGVALSIPLAVYTIVHKLFIQRKEKQMKPLHLKEHIFNLNAIVMVEPYDEGGVVHCTDNHAYRISETEYQELRKLLGKD